MGKLLCLAFHCLFSTSYQFHYSFICSLIVVLVDEEWNQSFQVLIARLLSERFSLTYF